jgi:hypothetical protein
MTAFTIVFMCSWVEADLLIGPYPAVREALVEQLCRSRPKFAVIGSFPRSLGYGRYSLADHAENQHEQSEIDVKMTNTAKSQYREPAHVVLLLETQLPTSFLTSNSCNQYQAGSVELPHLKLATARHCATKNATRLWIANDSY